MTTNLRHGVGTRPVAPARQGALREHNLALALRRIVEARKPVSRADIAAATGMTRATASSLVNSLVEGGLVREVGPNARVGGGRPGGGLSLSQSGPAGMGLEVNVDYAATCVVDLSGAVRHRRVIAADFRGRSPGRTIGTTAKAARAVARAAHQEGLIVVGAALAVPGLVRAPDGPLQFAPNLGWRDVDVISLLRRQAGFADLPVTVDNEANFAALGELATGMHGNTFLHVSGEIGIGAGIVIDGQIFRGQHGWSGELGHITVDPAGPPCTCGSRGCLERYAGQETLLRASGAARPAATTLSSERALDILRAEATSGNSNLLAALDRAGEALGLTVATALNLLDLDRVVLGGIYGPLAPWLAAGVKTELARRVVAAPWTPPRVDVAVLGADAAMLGAARSVVGRVLDNPAQWLAIAH